MKKTLVVILISLISIFSFYILNNKKEEPKKIEVKTINLGNLVGNNIKDHKIKNVNIIEEESSELVGTIIKQDKEIIKENETVNLTVSKGLDYKKYKVNELGRIPVMMYHGIVNQEHTNYVGGNVDKDGYHRTTNAFKKDLEFYYNEGYRMIRLTDYVDGIIDVEAGYSPIVLTFDDGLANNIKVTGLDESGEIIIDPNSAVGVLEEFKKKYKTPVTATFFVNGGLFNQPEYNDKIMKWLVKNGYDIGNHTNTHVNFSLVDVNRSTEEVGIMYNKLDSIIPGEYVNIIALPFGSPYRLNHPNFDSILKGNYNGKDYTTKSTLRVGWESDYSPFDPNFDKKFIKRIRAYDNNGLECDISSNFNILKNNRYISDGNKNVITVLDSQKETIKNDSNLVIRIFN